MASSTAISDYLSKFYPSPPPVYSPPPAADSPPPPPPVASPPPVCVPTSYKAGDLLTAAKDNNLNQVKALLLAACNANVDEKNSVSVALK